MYSTLLRFQRLHALMLRDMSARMSEWNDLYAYNVKN